MHGSDGPDGDLVPFRTLVLDEDSATLVPRPRPASERARQFRAQADAPATVRAYAADWRHFERWCRAHGQQPFGGAAPLEPVVGDYLASLGTTQAMSTLRRRVAAIVRQARLARVPFDTKSPEIREVLRGIGHAHRRDPRQAAALTTPEIQKLVGTCGPGLAGLRDRALILVGFAGALRRSELVALGCRHVQWTARGMTLRIARSKTDSEGKDIGIPLGRHAETCPVTHLRRWVVAAGIRGRRAVPPRGSLGQGWVQADEPGQRAAGPRAPCRRGRHGRHPARADQPARAARGLHHHGLRQRRLRRADHGAHKAEESRDHARLRPPRPPRPRQPRRERRAVTALPCRLGLLSSQTHAASAI